MQKNGFIASSLLYGMLALFLTITLSTLAVFANNKLSMDKLREKAFEDIDDSPSEEVINLEMPTFEEKVQGEVVIKYLQGCTNGITCQYSTNGGSTWTTVTSNPTVYIGEDNTTVIARVTDGTTTVTAPAYTVVRDKLYVSSSGDDTTGYGTINKPYATISKAYTSGASTSTIYVMNSISPTNTTAMDGNKTITLTSCTKSGSGTSATCNYSSTNTINKTSSYTDTSNHMLDLGSGTLTLNNITLNGNNESFTGGGLLGRNGSTINLLTGTTITQFKSTNSNGPAVRINDAPNTSTASTVVGLVIDGANITNNTSATSGGAIAVGPYRKAQMKNGTISGNTTGDTGGGIIVWNGASFTLSGGTISGNKANTAGKWGGGISVDTNSTFTMTGGTIGGSDAAERNTAAAYGGGLYCGATSTCTMLAGTISGNTAGTIGGGVAIHASGRFTLSGGSIRGNSAPGGGGIGKLTNAATYTKSGSPTCSGNNQNGLSSSCVWTSN